VKGNVDYNYPPPNYLVNWSKNMKVKLSHKN